MTRKQIEKIAKEHDVDESHIRGKTKGELLRNVDAWFNRLLGFEILINYKSVNGDENEKVLELREKRDNLRAALGIES